MEQTKKTSSKTLTNFRRKISCYEFSFLEFLAVKFTFFYRLLMNWRTSVFLREITEAKITASDKVLHMGCGTLPSASIFIAEHCKAHVVGIDNNKTAVRLARDYISKKGLGEWITIEYGDGASYPLADFDVIFIAINVWPIDTVLRHIAQHGKNKVRIICKDVKDDIPPLIATEEFRDIFSIVHTIQHERSQSLLLEKTT